MKRRDFSKLPAHAAELVALGVSVIGATGDVGSARAAMAATSTIPIVFTKTSRLRRSSASRCRKACSRSPTR
jgi:hypothetical protein